MAEEKVLRGDDYRLVIKLAKEDAKQNPVKVMKLTDLSISTENSKEKEVTKDGDIVYDGEKTQTISASGFISFKDKATDKIRTALEKGEQVRVWVDCLVPDEEEEKLREDEKQEGKRLVQSRFGYAYVPSLEDALGEGLATISTEFNVINYMKTGYRWVDEKEIKAMKGDYDFEDVNDKNGEFVAGKTEETKKVEE